MSVRDYMYVNEFEQLTHVKINLIACTQERERERERYNDRSNIVERGEIKTSIRHTSIRRRSFLSIICIFRMTVTEMHT
jgi:hypothetical protein